MRFMWLVVAVLVSLVSHAPPAAADPPERTGWMFGLGLGAASAAVTDDATGEGSARETGFASGLRIGKVVRPDLGVSLELSSWIKNIDDVSLALGLTTLSASYYPRGAAGLVLRGGVGLGLVTAEAAFGPRVTTSSDFGFGVLAGAGYEFQLTPGFTIGPNVSYAWSDQPGYTFNQFGGTVDLNWYFGGSQ